LATKKIKFLALQNAENHGKNCNPGATKIPEGSLYSGNARTHRERRRRNFSRRHLPLHLRRPPALADLYRASCPDVTFRELAADLNDATIPYWYAFEDTQREIRVAMLVWNNGAVWVVARPDDCESLEVKRIFL
jgi:hypothetical protein